MERLVICGENSLDACKMARFVSLRWFMSMRAFWGGWPVNDFNIDRWVGHMGHVGCIGHMGQKGGEPHMHYT